MNVVAVNVRGPRNDVFGMAKLLWLGADVRAINGDDASFARI